MRSNSTYLALIGFSSLALICLLVWLSFPILAAQASVQLSIAVTNRDSAPLAGVKVYLDGELRGTTGEDGFYFLELSEPGTYSLTLRAEGFKPLTKPIKVSAEDVQTVNLVLSQENQSQGQTRYQTGGRKENDKQAAEHPEETKKEQGRVGVSVYGPEGQPMQGVKVLANGEVVGKTDSEGLLLFQIETGEHEIGAEKEGYDQASQAARIEKDELTQLIFTLAEEKNQKPIPKFTYSPSKPVKNQQVTFNASGSRDPDGRIVEYRWDFDGDGKVDLTGEKVRTTFNSAREYSPTLTVVDEDRGESVKTEPITINRPNQPPRAAISLSPSEPYTGQEVELICSGCSDPDGRIRSFEWSSEGEKLGTGKRIHTTFQSPKLYHLKLTLTDNQGGTTTKTKQIKVRPVRLYSRVFSNKDSDRSWESGEVKVGDTSTAIASKQHNRKLTLQVTNDGSVPISVKLAPHHEGLIKVISQIEARLSNSNIYMRGKGFLQVGEVEFSLSKGQREETISDWNENLVRSDTKKLEIKNSGLTHLSFSIHFLTKESLEIVALDLLVNAKREPVALSVTELFNYRKLLGAKACLKAGLQPKEFNIPPHAVAYPPAKSQVGADTTVKFMAFDPDGQIDHLKVEWGDGSKQVVSNPSSGRFRVSHTYEDPGEYTVQATAVDDYKPEAKTEKLSFKIEVKEQRDRTRNSRQEDGGEDSSGGGSSPKSSSAFFALQ